MFDRILIANRGEIAVRIIKTCQRLGIETVAIFTDNDKYSQHIKLATLAVPLTGDHRAYLDSEQIISIAQSTQCQAIHPGYGFLSENAEFSLLCQQGKLVFIGPSSQNIKDMGCKRTAKQIMSSAGVPTTPGIIDAIQDPETLLTKAKEIGFPVLIKATSGGGGKGMKLVEKEADFVAHLKSAQREAKASFKDDGVILEKYLKRPRHIEVQVVRDSQGNCLHLYERDCSIQRRHQKIIEEAPACGLSEKVKKTLFESALLACNAIQYLGVGTIEFLVEDNNVYFMEMNTRLQVEHPVTEAITGIDLVEWQIIIAAGESLPYKQSSVPLDGHAIEVRLYAEDPSNNFLPQTGTLTECYIPESLPTVRADGGVQTGDIISIHYDPMIAKLIVWGKDRRQAIYLMEEALKKTRLIGITTNLNFLRLVIHSKTFSHDDISTQFLNEWTKPTVADEKQLALICLTIHQSLSKATTDTPWQFKDGWHNGDKNIIRESYQDENNLAETYLIKQAKNQYLSILPTEGSFKCLASSDTTITLLINDKQTVTAQIHTSSDSFLVVMPIQSYEISYPTNLFANNAETLSDLTSPMPGTVIQVKHQQGDMVKKGEAIMIIEAMKMEHTIQSPMDGIIEKIFFKEGQQVDSDAPLLSIVEQENI